MPRYFFHTQDGRCIADKDGSELPDERVARIEAVKLLGELLQASPETFWNAGKLSVTVTDEEGDRLFSIDCSGAGAETEPYQKPLG